MKRKRAQYDPDHAQDASWWAALDEAEQIDLVSAHHRRAGVELPNAALHAATHVIIENQILLGEETAVASTLERLLGEGLSRHDAIHAIGTALAPILFETLRGESSSDPNPAYSDALSGLTAANWLAEYS